MTRGVEAARVVRIAAARVRIAAASDIALSCHRSRGFILPNPPPSPRKRRAVEDSLTDEGESD